MGSIELICYTKGDLGGLLEDERFWSQPQLPIPRRRVISQISNPRACDHDVVLITASKKSRMVAYLGILPDLVRSEEQKPVKFGWLTAWWVDKESDSRVAATMVLFAAMKKYAYKVAASSPSADAMRVYDATRQFHECARVERSYFVMGLPPSFLFLSTASRWLSGASNELIACRALKRRGLEIRIVDSLNEELMSFIGRRTADDPLDRDAAYWDWVLKFPWMSANPDDRDMQRAYAFSLYAGDFRQIPMTVTRHGRMLAFLVATQRDRRLSLKYALYDAADVAEVTAALKVVIGQLKPWLFVCADGNLNIALEAQLRCLMKRAKNSSIYATKLLPLPAGPWLQFGTGDIIFT